VTVYWAAHDDDWEFAEISGYNIVFENNEITRMHYVSEPILVCAFIIVGEAE